MRRSGLLNPALTSAVAATGNGAQPSYPTTESALPEVTDA